MFSQSRQQGLTVRALNQGIYIARQGNIHYQTAEWVVLATIDSPPPTDQALHFAAVLSKKIQEVRQNYPQLTPSWHTRISWCREYLLQFSQSRTKRAPLGFIGRLSHTLFGTVTEEELQQYRSIISANSQSVNTTIHRVNLLLSATKQIQINVNRNSAHLFKLQRYISSISRTISISFLQAKRALEHMELKFKLEHAVASLEQSTHHILAYYNRRRRQMNNIYHKSLSEDVLPVEHLKEIIRQASALGYHAMMPQWYYQNCKLSPVWYSLNTITYRVHLPLHDGQSYLLHSIRSIPYPVKPGFKAQLKVKKRIAYSSSSGSLFRPILCMGTEQSVCRGGPLYRASTFICERALLAKDATAIHQCPTRLLPSNSTDITEDTPGFYTISTFSIQVHLHCDGDSEKIIKLHDGVYIVSMNHSCTLRNQQWTLPGLNRFKSPLHLRTQAVPVSLSSIFSPFNPVQLEKIAQAPHWTPLNQLHVLTADPLPEIRPWIPWRNVNTVTWINSTTIGVILICAVIFFVGYKLYKRRSKLPRFFQRRQPSAPTSIEMATVIPPPPSNNPHPDVRLPMYPDLARESSRPENP